jgi:hypothetical protein
VYGTSNPRNASGTLSPQWECFVDGVSIGFDRPIANATQNNYGLCSTFNQTFARHTLTLNVTAADGRPFYVDSIRYLPLANLTSELDHPTVIVDQLDTSITYTPADQWQTVAGTEDVTLALEPGSSMSVNFTGSKVTWMGWTPSGYPTGQSTAQYKLDDAAPVTFQLRGLGAGATTQVNQPFFETPTVEKGNHQLTVTHLGTSAPLVLDYLVVEDGDIIFGNTHTTSTSASTSRPTATSTTGTPGGSNADGSTSSDGKKFPVGAVVGGAVGGLAAITILLFLVLFLRRRRARLSKSIPPHSQPPSAPAMYQSVPSTGGPSYPPFGTPVIQEESVLVPLSTGHASTTSKGSHTHQHSLSNPNNYLYTDGSEYAHQPTPQPQRLERLEPLRKKSPDPLPSAGLQSQNAFAASVPGDASDPLVPPSGRGIHIPNSPNVIY